LRYPYCWGGGGGGRWRAGGGGGDVLYFENITLNGTYNINVGKGGAVPRDTSHVHYWGGYNGNISSITGGNIGNTLNINASGGAGAGGWNLAPLNPEIVSYTNPSTGGTETSSGGGAGTANLTYTPSTGNDVSGNGAQGDYDGNDNSADDGAGGGGGGGGTNGNGGLPVGETGGVGGNGENIDITGTTIMYGRGGDGWGTNNGTPTITPENIGQGGAGADHQTGIHRAGGSGIVIIRKYLEPVALYEEQTTVTQNPLLPADSTNLVVWYKLDGNYDDSSGNGNTLIPQGNNPNGLTFNTLSDNNFPYSQWAYSTQTANQSWAKSPNINKNVPISIAFWFRKTGTASLMTILGYGDFPTGAIQFDLISNKLRIYTALSGYWTTYPEYTGITNNVWYHCVYVLTNENPVKTYLYVNGIQRATGTGSVNATLYKAVNITIANSGDGSRGFEGDIGDFRFYDKALSAYEIDILANNKIENPDYKILTFTYQGPSYPVIDADAASLVAHYKFDSGEELTDSVGNYPLTNDGSVSFPSDTKIVGKSSYFPNINSDGFLNITGGFNPYTIWNGNGISFSIWYKINLNDSDTAGRIFEFGNTNIHLIWMAVQLNGTGDNNLSLYAKGGHTGGNGPTISVGNGTLDGNWHYIVWIVDTNSDWHCYIDGVNQNITANWDIPNITGGYTTNRLGKSIYKNDTTQDLKGYLDDFRIYDKALSATEISDLYNQYNQTSYTVNFPEETECDILIVGGGGGGGTGIYGGGGGAGGLVFQQNLVLNGSNTVKVGKGGNETNGFDSSINDIIAIGGGLGGSRDLNTTGSSGGSGGGGSGTSGTGILAGGSGTAGQGNDGGDGYHYSGQGAEGGGGGGAGFAGNSAEISSNAGYKSGEKGGDGLAEKNGIDFKNHFTITDTNIGEHHTDGKVYFAGGGGGSGAQAGSTVGERGEGGLGGGGFKTSNPPSGARGALNNSGGVGGQADSGGSGIVIIRYYTKYIRQHPAYDAQWTYHSANPNVHHYGNVGIGTLASETNKLTVKGDINVIGDIYENNNKIAYGWDVYGNSVYNQYGNVGIGTNDPRYALHTTGVIYAGQGGITETGSTTWTITSDNRIKENIEKASYDICSENIKNINLYRFNYNTKYVKTTDKNQLGFIAQDVRKYFPKAVKNKTTRFDNDVVPNLLSVDVTQLNYTMYGAVKHIGQDIDAIKEKLGITEVPTEIKNEPYAIEVVPFNDPDAELPIVNEEPATN